MFTLIKFIFYCTLLIFAFLGGVKYSDESKEVANWIFEEKEEEISLEEIKDDLKNNVESFDKKNTYNNSVPDNINDNQQNGAE